MEKIQVLMQAGQVTLKKFGYAMAFIIPLFFGLFIPNLLHERLSPVPWLVGFIVGATAFVRPRLLVIVYVPWMMVGDILGLINRWIVLTVLFYLIITPVACILKYVFHKDSMERACLLAVPSYRKIVQKKEKSNSFLFPY